MTPPTEDEIAALRVANNVPAHWVWGWCDSDCGDIAFYDPTAEQAAHEKGVRFALFCSAACIQTYLQETPPDVRR